MAWTVDFESNLQIVVLTYLGKVTGEEVQEAAAARIDMGREKGVTKFLIDAKKLDADRFVTSSVYDIPTRLYPEKDFQKTNYIAILSPELETSKEMVKFFENVCRNRGWQVKMFPHYEIAMEWLRQKT